MRVRIGDKVPAFLREQRLFDAEVGVAFAEGADGFGSVLDD